ncbi:LytR/AlgR family response regulator transcription factor [Xylanimonas protaetiae]|uniref:Response regulator n=1 Tax=Xylanimonas protaetiae TaxID=2509457 RepID=A0A4P6F2I0_9MICO|nr:response regulator transcription factor [Xylanimonas protaetiae]QAY69762.1 response regulator [Xylanimonas protaetiae]
MCPTVLIVDDHAEFRRVARELLEADRFTVVGESADAADALRAVEALQPDVVLLDVRLPDGSGLDVAQAMSALPSAPHVVLTSTADYAWAASASGAVGFVAKAGLSGPALRALIEVA